MKQSSRFSTLSLMILPLMALFALQAAAAPTLEELLQPRKFHQASLSPDGEKLAVVSREDGQRVLALMTLEPLEITYVLRFTGSQEVGDFHWVNDERIVTTVWKQQGWLDSPQLANFLYAVNYDGGARKTVYGYEVGYSSGQTSSRIRKQRPETAHAEIISTLPGDDSHVLISTYPWTLKGHYWHFTGETYGEVLRLNVYNGRTKKVVSLPGRGGRGYADDSGEVHFADGVNADGIREFYHYRDGAWQRLGNPEQDYVAWVTGYGDSGRAYLVVNNEEDRFKLVRADLESGAMTPVYSHPRVDIEEVANYPGTGEPMSVVVEDGLPEPHFFDPAHSVSRYIRGIHQAFPGQRVRVESESAGGETILVSVAGDNRPGDLFLVHLPTRKAKQLLSAASWLEPGELARTESFDFRARDGQALQGYLTFPVGAGRERLPLVVLPHGGPSARDYWRYNRELQILARAGYLVMQVNFRGSDGYGDAFRTAAYGHWGDTVQDDIADATRWAIGQGLADPERVCIYGGSFGAYSAMMNVIREPALYQCAAGFAGVYDLQMMYERGDIKQRMAGRAYLDRALGRDGEQLAAFSPARNAQKVKVPVFLAHGGEDLRAPIEHAEALEEALRAAGVDVTTQYYDKGGHGYYTVDANRKLYRGLLDFLDKHIGG